MSENGIGDAFTGLPMSKIIGKLLMIWVNLKTSCQIKILNKCS